MAAASPDYEQQVSRLSLPAPKQSPWVKIAIRVGIALACVGITSLLVWLERDGYTDTADGIVSFWDAIYYATVTLSTTGYGDISPVSDSARLTNVLVITPLRFVFLIVLIGTTIETLSASARRDYKIKQWEKRMSDHTVVVGYGVKGRSAVDSLIANGTPQKKIVVVSDDPEAEADAHRRGIAMVVGDARREDILRDAGAERAARIIIAADADDTAVLVTLTARRMAKDAKIVCAARESTNAEILRRSGADGVIVTAEAAGRMLSMQLNSPSAGELMEDLLDTSRGLEMIEREIMPEELGRTPRELEDGGLKVLMVIRGGDSFRFDEFDRDGRKVLQRDDRIVVVQQRSAGTNLFQEPGL